MTYTAHICTLLKSMVNLKQRYHIILQRTWVVLLRLESLKSGWHVFSFILTFPSTIAANKNQQSTARLIICVFCIWWTSAISNTYSTSQTVTGWSAVSGRRVIPTFPTHRFIFYHMRFWPQYQLLVGGIPTSTPLKKISQLEELFPIYGKTKNETNHQPVLTSVSYGLSSLELLVPALLWFVPIPETGAEFTAMSFEHATL